MLQHKIKSDNKYASKSNVTDKLEFTDASGNKNQLLFATKSNFVATETGVSQEQQIASLVDVLKETVTSTDGQGLEISNCIPNQKLLGLSVEGETVKSMMYTECDLTGLTGIWQKIYNDDLSLQAGTYTFICDKPLLWAIGFTYEDGTEKYESLRAVEGTRVTLAITKATTKVQLYNAKDYEGDYKVLVCIVHGDGNSTLRPIQPGLHSAQAILNVNGQHYPLTTIDSDTGEQKVICCGEGTTVTVHDDMSVRIEDEWKEVVLDGSENWGMSTSITDTTLMRFVLFVEDAALDTACESNMFEGANKLSSSITKECIGIQGNTSTISLFIKKERLQTEDLTGFKAWLSQNILQVRYQVATPTITTIDKSINKAIPISTDKISISTGDSVAPKEFSVTLAVDKVSQIERRLDMLLTMLNSKSNLTLLDNYINDEFQNEQKNM